MPDYDKIFNELNSAISFDESPNPQNEAYWRKKLANQGQLKAPPPRSAWRKFMDGLTYIGENIEEGMRTGPASIIATTVAPLVETGDQKTYTERRKSFAAQEKRRRQEFAAENAPQDVGDYALAIPGQIIGSLISDPTNLIGGPAKTLGGKVLTAGSIGAAADTALQGAEVAGDIRDEYNPLQTAINAGASGAFAAGAHGIGKLREKYRSGEEGPRSPTDDEPEDPIDSRIRKLDDLASHPETPKNEAEAARRMAERLRTKYGRTTPAQPEAAPETSFREATTLTLEDAAALGKRYGTVTSTRRSPERNKKVGGAKRSYHLSGRAMDIARSDGVSHKQIEAALRRAGYNIVESIDEGDHSHFAFDFGKPTAVSGIINQGEINNPVNDLKYNPQLAQLEPDLPVNIRPADLDEVDSLVPGDQPFNIDGETIYAQNEAEAQEIYSAIQKQNESEDFDLQLDEPTLPEPQGPAPVIQFPVVPRIEAVTHQDPMAKADREFEDAYAAYSNGDLSYEDYKAADKKWQDTWDSVNRIGEGTDNPNVVSFSRAKADREIEADKERRRILQEAKQKAIDEDVAKITSRQEAAQAVLDAVLAKDPQITEREWLEVVNEYNAPKVLDKMMDEGVAHEVADAQRALMKILDETTEAFKQRRADRAEQLEIQRKGSPGKHFRPRNPDSPLTPVNDKNALKRKEQFIKDSSGKPAVFYHGTYKPYEGLPDPQKNRVPVGMVIFSTDRSFANAYTGKGGGSTESQRIFPVYIDKEGIADYRNPKDVEKVIEWYKKDKSTRYTDGYDDVNEDYVPVEAIKNGDWHLWENPQMLKELGYKGTYMTEYGPTTGLRTLNIGIFEPDQFASKFEMIDPTPDRSTVPQGYTTYPAGKKDHVGRLLWANAHPPRPLSDKDETLDPNKLSAIIKSVLGDSDMSKELASIDDVVAGTQTAAPEAKPNTFVQLLKDILQDESGILRPDELWRTLSNWRDRKAAYEASRAGPVEPPDPVVPVLERLFEGIKLAKKASPEQKKAYADERSRRVGKAVQRSQHTSGLGGLKAEKSELSGELPRIDLEPIRDQFTPEEIDMIMDDVKASRKLSYLEGVSTRDAIDALLDGKLPAPHELAYMYRVYPQLVDSILKKRSTEDKFKEFLKEVWETSRGSMGSGDVSFSGRQGGMMISRPEWWKSTLKQFTTLPATKGKEVMDEQVERIVNHPLYDHLKKMGIELMDTGGHGKRDEFAVKSLAEMKYSPTRLIVQASNRAYTYMANELRPQLALNILQRHKDKGVNIDDEAYLKTLGEYLNTFTGRGKFNNKVLDAAMPMANLVMFAPRFVLSTFKRFSPFLWGKMLKHPAILKEAVRDSGAYLMTLFGVLALADHNGYEVEWDVRSPTGLKIKHGNTTYDIGAGLIQTASLLEKIRTNEKITGKGKKIDMSEDKYGQDDLGDITGKFFRTKLHPSLAYLTDMRLGKNVVGEEFDLMKDTAELFIPMYSTTVGEHIQEVGVEGSAAALPAFLGVGLNTYKPPKQKEKKGSDPYDKLFKELENYDSGSVDDLEKFFEEQGL